MQNNKVINQDLDFLGVLRSLAVAYEDISIIKMQQTRNTIFQARLYIDSLKDILKTIQSAGIRNPYTYYERTKKKPLATVVITANTPFQGDLSRRIFDFFSHSTPEKSDIFVIGKIGKEYMKELDSKLPYTDFEVSDIDSTMKELQPFLAQLLQYKKINVYYAVFKNLMIQQPTKIDIANIELLSADQMRELRRTVTLPDFLFEPSVEEITTFVNDNSIALMLLQTVYETQLARFASRMKAMDTLIQKIDEDVLRIRHTQRKINRQSEQAKQLERLTGVSLW